MVTTNKKALCGALLFMLAVSVAAFGRAPSGTINSLAISPDGKQIAVAFGSGKNSFIYMVPVETGVARRLTSVTGGTESFPSFSVDGKRIAYTYWPSDEKQSRIVIVNVDGSNLRQWSPIGSNDASPVFSADDKTIVFSRFGLFGNYSPIAQLHPHEWDFYAADLNSGNVRQITNESFYSASAPSISPDGKNMAAVVQSLQTSERIVVYSLDHPGKPVLSLQPHVPHEADHKDPIYDCPNFTPDGESILFMAASNGKPFKGYDYDVYRVDIETGAIEALTNGNGYATDLRASANGKSAVFLKWRSDWHATPVSNDLYLLDLQSRALIPLKITGLN